MTKIKINTVLTVWNSYDIYTGGAIPLCKSSAQRGGFFYELVCAYDHFICVYSNEGVWPDWAYVFNKNGWEYEVTLSEDKEYLLIRCNY